MNNADNYDEFGTYIGPEIESDEEEDNYFDNNEDRDFEMNEMPVENVEIQPQSAVVIHEERKYYPSSEEVYGKDVEIRVEEEDMQPLSEPIIQPIKVKKVQATEKTIPITTYEPEFLASLLESQTLVRNVCFAGHLHHGKTSFVDLLIQQTHEEKWRRKKNQRYTDTRIDEQEMKISAKLTTITLALQTSRAKHYAIAIADTPGHPNFIDEVVAGMRLADGVVLVIDIVEGPLVQTELAIKAAAREGLPIVVIFNKLDRLILELKLPPQDAYFKIRHMVEQINTLVHTHIPNHPRLSPDVGNILFASPEQGYCFTLESFAEMYIERFWHQPKTSKKKGFESTAQGGYDFTPKEFAKRLWGDVFYHPVTRTFRRIGLEDDGSTRLLRTSQRSFVQFVLEPLYKIYSYVVGEEREELEPLMNELNIRLNSTEYASDVRYLLRSVFGQLFGEANSFVDMVVKFLPSPIDGAKNKIQHTYTGPIPSYLLDDPYNDNEEDMSDLSNEERNEAAQARLFAKAMLTCSPNGPLSMNVVKLISKPDATKFDALARILSGRVSEKMKVRVLGETYSEYDQEASATETVSKIWLPQARYQIGVSTFCAGSWVLIEGIETSITKTATVVSEDENLSANALYIYRPLHFGTQSIVKIAIEPFNPSELPKMIEGLRKVNSSYPLVVTKKEENGEHVILGTGELYLDCVMRDLRTIFCDIEIKVSDPVVSFCETVSETSSYKCFASTLNKQNRLTVIAEPLERGLGEAIEKKQVSLSWEPRKVSEFFSTKYRYDSLEAKSVWAFGPTEQGPNIFIDDTLPTEVDKGTLMTVKRFLIQGFQWGTREGPLCEEPIRNVKFKLLDAVFAADEVGRSGAQLIPTSRRVCYTAMLMAKPCLMEPYLYVEVYCPDKYVVEVEKVIKGGSVSGFRRGYIDRFDPIPGTPITLCKCYIPAIDSFGLETNIRQWTQGQAFCLSMFDHWELVPGDPLDSSIKLVPLEPAKNTELAREFMVKTRRRKGLSDNVNAKKFFDEEMIRTKDFSELFG